ncbi:MAG: conjugative coupling factor TraD, PFGI-1 class, partial [Candidatus Methylumidiphilus sp.]
MLRVRELETAELLTKQLPEVQVHLMTLVSGVTDTSDTTLDVDFTSTNQDRINVVDAPMLVPADLVSLALGAGVLPVAGRATLEGALPLARHL